MLDAVRDAVGQLDGNLPVYGVRAMRDVVTGSPGVPARRLLTAAFSGFALLAVILSTVGIFGVAAHDVACRRGELAVRLALGANPAAILRATLGQGVMMVGSGLLLGGVLSIWAVRGLSGLVVTTGPPHLVSIAAAATVLMIAGIAAVLPVALRAARTDPLTALRSE